MKYSKLFPVSVVVASFFGVSAVSEAAQYCQLISGGTASQVTVFNGTSQGIFGYPIQPAALYAYPINANGLVISAMGTLVTPGSTSKPIVTNNSCEMVVTLQPLAAGDPFDPSTIPASQQACKTATNRYGAVVMGNNISVRDVSATDGDQNGCDPS